MSAGRIGHVAGLNDGDGPADYHHRSGAAAEDGRRLELEARGVQGVRTAVGGLDARSVAALTGGLAVGEVLPARVLTTAGDRVVIRLAERTLDASTTVPLEAGERVDLLVARASGGKLVLRIVGEASRKGADSSSAALGTTRANPSASTSEPATVSVGGKMPSGVAAPAAGPSSVTIIGHGAQPAALVGSPGTATAAARCLRAPLRRPIPRLRRCWISLRRGVGKTPGPNPALLLRCSQTHRRATTDWPRSATIRPRRADQRKPSGPSSQVVGGT